MILLSIKNIKILINLFIIIKINLFNQKNLFIKIEKKTFNKKNNYLWLNKYYDKIFIKNI